MNAIAARAVEAMDFSSTAVFAAGSFGELGISVELLDCWKLSGS